MKNSQHLNHTLFLLIFLIFATGLYAQNTGYLGKRVIVKTNLVNGKFLPISNAELEVVVKRNISLYYNVGRFQYQPSVVSRKENRYEYYHTLINIKPYESNGFMHNIGAKYYFDKIIPAPVGLYTSIDLGLGGVYYGYEFEKKKLKNNIDNQTGKITESYIILNEGKRKSANYFFQFSAPSIGYQTVMTNFLTVDAKFCLEGFITKMDPTYGYKYLSSNLVSMRIGSIIFGPAIYIKAGILLF
jgi:hypothetical protein